MSRIETQLHSMICAVSYFLNLWSLALKRRKQTPDNMRVKIIFRSSSEFFPVLFFWYDYFLPRRSAVWPLGIPWPLQGTGLLHILVLSLRIYTWRMCRMFHISALILTGSESCVCCARDFGGSACYRCILVSPLPLAWTHSDPFFLTFLVAS